MGNDAPLSWMTTLGTPLYWTLLLSMVIVTPIVALATERAIANRLPAVDVPLWIPLALAAAMLTYCFTKLALAGGLTAQEALDRSVCYEQKIERRVALMKLLGNHYYSLVYSSLPIVACYLLARSLLRKDRIAGAAFLALSAAILWLSVAMVMKAPVLIYLGFVTLTLMMCGFGWFRTPAIMVPLAIGVFLVLSNLQFCPKDFATWKKVDGPTAASATTASTVTPLERVLYFSRNAAFRMASTFPYYVQEFSDEKERCGIDLPPQIRKPACYGSIEVFRLMYPKITYVTGHAPAPAQVSAYAEGGPAYVVVVLIAIGVIIGTVAGSARGRDPLSVAIGVALCVFSYYVTQSSFTGALIHSYGLAWLLFPIVLIALAGILIHRSASPRLSASASPQADELDRLPVSTAHQRKQPARRSVQPKNR